MRSTVAALACLILAACASPAPAPAPEPLSPSSLFLDAAFQPRAVPADPKIFAMNDAMRGYLVEIAPALRIHGHLRGLVTALETNSRLKLEYDSTVTRNAAEAFDARAGNCLSLTLLTAAFARELGISVSFQRVLSEPLWTRIGDTLFSNGHVNVMLGAAMLPERGMRGVRGVIIDYTPSADIRSQRSQQISEATVVAMYMNNRAAETMRAGSLDDAYWWVRGAIQRDPSYLEAVNTLGVVYSHRGRPAQAERVFRYVLAIEPDNVSALANLVGAVERQGRGAEALALGARLKTIEAQPPFHYFDLGLEALRAKDYAAARDHFQRELRRNAYYHEAHFGLAAAYIGLGETKIARRHLATALETSTNRDAGSIYSAKLEWLRAHRIE